MTSKIKKLTCLALACVGLLSGCGGGKDNDAPPEEYYGGLLENGEAQQVEPLQAVDDVFSLNYSSTAGYNPFRTSSGANLRFSTLMYETLFTVDEDFNLSSELVTGYTDSENYTWWVFNINTDVLFHDGSSLTAEDVAYSIGKAQRSEIYSNRLSCIYGVSAMGDGTLAVSTYEPNSQFPLLLNIPIIKKNTYDDFVPVGTGPYTLSESGDRLELFSGHRHGEDMPLKTIWLKEYSDTAERITAFEEASLDLVVNDPTGMYNLGYGSSNEIRYFDTTNMHYLGFNFESRYFQSYRMRYAVNYVVDREYLVKEIMNGCGTPAAIPVHPASAFFDRQYSDSFVYDLEKASAYFGSAGVKDYDDDGALEISMTGIIVELDIKFIVNNDSTAKVEEARAIARDLNSIGIATTLYELSYDEYIRRLECGEYDMYYGEIRLSPDWNIGYLFDVPEKRYNPDKDASFTGMNYAYCFDPEYTRLYDAYLAADDASRENALREACHKVCDNGAIIPLCFEKRQLLTHRGVMTGLCPTQYDIFNRFYDWKIDLK